MIVGIDEVGRGAWAGPLVVGAVVLGGRQIDGLTDSKKLTAKKRNLLAKEIKENAVAIGLGWVSAEMIDRIGLSEALKMACRLSLKDITVEYDQIIIDGTVRLVDDPRVVVQKQADLLVPSVSAASIIAKVARDYYMQQVIAPKYPGYGFETHVGYGTATHQKGLETHGASQLHRLSFSPVKKALGQEVTSAKKSSKIKDTIGHKAEQAAALFLQQQGFMIVEQNWRTKLCEIDIVAQKNEVMYFVEVKYRKKTTQGSGIEAITSKKLHQMQFDARMWQHWHGFEGHSKLSVIALTDEPPQVQVFLESV